MSNLEKILAGLVALMASAGVIAGLWISHNHAEQKLGAQQCIQTTTIDHTEAKADVASDQAAQAVDIKAVVQGYETKVLSLQHDNDDLAGRLLASGALRPRRVPDSGSAAGANCPVPGLSAGESEAAGRSAAITQADLTAVLNAADANQVKTEDCAKIYNGVRDRAIAAAAQLPKPP
jgi:hypothetical protein